RTGYVFQEYYDMNKCEFLEFEEKSPVLNKFTQVVGLFIYNKHFVAPYTRIGKDNVVSGARKYYTAPNLFINE
ncbi:MAG: glutathionylspermidine synthase, partial [Finegoldia magna]|nr:glutathionylspermidine synthase [Finegoldia magna]